ncbi:hypothetical protein [Tenacibaculum ascidiaceicola]|uniref:hypothetical protein n=1 Tax=Tenacibaculum ascidiaceicola TaxID=1699411 RepID=UPI0038931749
MDNKELFNKVSELTEKYEWDSIKLIISFTESGGYGLELFYKYSSDEYKEIIVSTRELRTNIEGIVSKYHVLKNSKEKFNKVFILINKNCQIDITYKYDLEKLRVEKLNNSLVFYQWANETLMNRIFDYEKEHNLLKPIYDEDDDLVDYENSWDSGVFTFKIVNNKLDYNIELIKDGISRNLPMPLPEYFIKGLLEHYKITNEELKEEWQPWNTLVIKSPNNDIPYNSWEEYVTYSLER